MPENENRSGHRQGLNPAQLEAVMATSGPVIVLAGAGSGKTKTLTARVVELINVGVNPSSILAVTFTNKAAREMKERVARQLELSRPDLRIGKWVEPWMGFSSFAPEVSTFHSFCLKVLRLDGKRIGLSEAFVIYDDDDQNRLIKKIVEQLNLSGRLGNPRAYQSAINAAKTLAWTVDDLREKGSKNGPFDEKLVEVFAQYEASLNQAHAVDFGDIICKTYRLFAEHPDMLDRYQDRFQYIMVDEYQDTNRAQYLLISKLAEKYCNLCVVGDEDQSIYKWRGADIRNIMDFRAEYPTAQMIKLEENYRSTRLIIEAASAVIRNNQDRYEKKLFTRNPEGEPVRVVGLSDERDEAEFVARSIATELAKDPSLSFDDVAVFYRSHAQSRAIEEALRKERSPYRIVGGVAFYDRKEIKDVLAYLRLAMNPMDSISLERVINVPTRGIGKTTVDKISAHARAHGLSMFSAIEELVRGQASFLTGAVVKKLQLFYDLIIELGRAAREEPITDVYQKVVQDSGYFTELKSEGTEEAKGRLENLEEFYSVVQMFMEEANSQGLTPADGLLRGFLSQITLESQALEADPDQGTVSLMTLHSSKGLEFPLVYLVGCEEGIFPSKRAIDESEWEDSAIEEERRLAYVGITRAMKVLTLTHAAMRRIYGQVQVAAPSRFLGEIPETHKRVEDRTRAGSSGIWMRKSELEKKSNGLRYDYGDSQAPTVEIDVTYGDSGEALQVGRQVKHAVYGKGKVCAIEGSAQDRKVTIEFPGHQKKKFLLRHVKLELL